MPATPLEKLHILGPDAQFDLCQSAGRPTPIAQAGATVSPRPSARRPLAPDDVRRHITTVQHPKRGRMPVLRTMQTNACAKDCFYCPFRAGRAFRRETFGPDELARVTDQLLRARLIEGLFLSSGVVGKGDHSMEKLVATAEILRRRHGFGGYIHLKLMPAASEAAVEAALRLADRVSMNLEAPNAARLARLSGTKDLNADLVAPLRRVARIARRLGRRVSATTQFVVGAAGESDAEILHTTGRLYAEVGLARAYFSAFRPVPDTPLDGQPPEDPRREHRLYQADFLMRQYGFDASELPLDAAGNLDRERDPKLAWARAHPERFPVEINRAPREDLLRVPGLGPRAVAAILAARAGGRLREPAHLRQLGIAANGALPWITLDGRRAARQLELPLRDLPRAPRPT
ncbi:MAG: radical SAM protein [Caldilineae bacterium]|nr:radical SAM protein [Caldilineae bacterium]